MPFDKSEKKVETETKPVVNTEGPDERLFRLKMIEGYEVRLREALRSCARTGGRCDCTGGRGEYLRIGGLREFIRPLQFTDD